MHAIAHGGCMDTVREKNHKRVCTESWLGEKFLAAWRNQTHVSTAPMFSVRCSTSRDIPTSLGGVLHMFWNVQWSGMKHWIHVNLIWTWSGIGSNGSPKTNAKIHYWSTVYTFWILQFILGPFHKELYLISIGFTCTTATTTKREKKRGCGNDCSVAVQLESSGRCKPHSCHCLVPQKDDANNHILLG